MKTLRVISWVILSTTVTVSLMADVLVSHHYAKQFREHPNEPPSRMFPLGTDDLGRDRLSRLLQGARVSVLCAPLAAIVCVSVAVVVGVVAACASGWVDRTATAVMDLFLSLPWLFALLAIRALLPLDVAPWVSIVATFTLFAAVGWAPGARIVRAAVAGVRHSSPILQARAYGCRPWRLMYFHLLPNLKPIITAQFWVLTPVFLITEANLGMLGLGIAEPIPSWGNLLVELQNHRRIPEEPWLLAPAIILVCVIGSLHVVVSESKTWE